MSTYCGICQSMVPDQHLCKVNSMGITHNCTYLSHVDGDVHRAMVAENALLKEALKECLVCIASELLTEKLSPGRIAPSNLPIIQRAHDLALQALTKAHHNAHNRI